MKQTKYRRFQHAQIDRIEPGAIRKRLPRNMPRPMRRQLAKTITKLERLAQKGVDVPSLIVDYSDLEGGVSRFHYIPGNQADRIADELLEAEAMLAARQWKAHA